MGDLRYLGFEISDSGEFEISRGVEIGGDLRYLAGLR